MKNQDLLREFIELACATPQDQLPGGRADNISPANVDPEQLAMGIEHEMEHTHDPSLAREIAMDHLLEDPLYYSHLQTIEAFDKGVKSDKSYKKTSATIPKEDKDEVNDWLDDMGMS